MASAMENITITVKVPFGGDRTVTTQPLVTVKELTETVMATCQNETFRGIPQCIVQSGRILPETSTLQDAGVSNGAVLHLMRRPRDERRIPGRRRSSQSRSRRTSNDDPNSAEVSDAPHDESHSHDEDDHDHHHDTEHHIHTNVIIGHIAVDGRIRYNDAHDMLLSVLHAVGFSTRAVRSAAAVAAAIAVATQSSEERGGASRTVLEHAWQTTRRLQEQLAREGVAVSSAPVSRTDAEAERVPSRQVIPPSPTTATDATEGSSSPATESTSRPAGQPVQSQPPGVVQMSVDAGTAASESPSSEQPSQRTMPALLPEELPSTPGGETLLRASGRAANHLLPVIADLMEVTASRLRNAPSMIDLEGSDRLEAAEMLAEQLGSVASVVTFVTTLVSTLLPDPDDLRTRHRSNRSGNSEPTQGSGQGRQGNMGARGADRTTPTALNGSRSSGGTESIRQETPPTERAGSTSSNGHPRGSRTRSPSRSENPPRSGSQIFGMFPPGNTPERNQGASGSTRRVRRSRRVRVSSSQAANADFMIRVLSYYFCSLSDINIPTGSGPPEVAGQTAVSVLDGLYGTNNTARPANTFLRIVHFAMQKLTPRQFHEICRGNMKPLAAIRQDLWREISRLVHRYHGPAVERGDVEELFVDHVCEALHEFVHVLESADQASEDNVFTPGPEDFCHHIMHTIQRKTEVFANILAVSRSEDDFSGRMSRWLKGAIGEILLAIALELEMQWDGLLTSFRRAVFEIGKTVVGSQFSVIFPCIANLYASRANTSYQRIASRHPEAHHSHPDRSSGHTHTNGELDDSSCGPGCERHQAMLDGDSASRSHGSGDETIEADYTARVVDDTDSDMPELGDQDSDDASADDDDESMDDAMDTDSGTTDRKALFHCLDDAELQELADELDAESQNLEVNTEVEGNLADKDLVAMASDLAAEVGSSVAKPVETSAPSLKPKKLETGPSKRMATMSAQKTANHIRPSSVNPVLSMPGSLPSSSANRATFSSAAVSRGGGSSSTSVLKNDFEKILGAKDGLRWKQVIERDQVRIRERRYGPLSRGYSGETSVAQRLDSKRGSELAADAAKQAAKEAKLSPERARELERVALESGTQYTTEMERVIGSRLRSDPDFNKQRFPRAAKRFLPKGS